MVLQFRFSLLGFVMLWVDWWLLTAYFVMCLCCLCVSGVGIIYWCLLSFGGGGLALLALDLMTLDLELVCFASCLAVVFCLIVC